MTETPKEQELPSVWLQHGELVFCPGFEAHNSHTMATYTKRNFLQEEYVPKANFIEGAKHGRSGAAGKIAELEQSFRWEQDTCRAHMAEIHRRGKKISELESQLLAKDKELAEALKQEGEGREEAFQEVSRELSKAEWSVVHSTFRYLDEKIRLERLGRRQKEKE